jgi:GntR family transcriptional repressor for pyruvate dehydrogenase complex
MPRRTPAATPLTFTPTRRERVPAEIVRQLKATILTGRVRPGHRLPSENELAAQFQSSRGSVREAIRSLEHAGLVAVRRGHGGGVFVGDGDLRHVVDSLSALIRLGTVSIHALTETRLILEPENARLAARRITAEALAGLKRYTEGHARAIAQRQLHATADLGFHRLIAEASGNPVLVLFTNSMADLLVQEVVARLDMDEAINRRNLHFHRRIFRALSRRDADGAGRLMFRHVADVQRRLETLLPRER